MAGIIDEVSVMRLLNKTNRVKKHPIGHTQVHSNQRDRLDPQAELPQSFETYWLDDETARSCVLLVKSVEVGRVRRVQKSMLRERGGEEG